MTAIRRSVMLSAAALLIPTAARAHLVTSGLGPFYDGISHFALTFEDLIPALAVALYAGLRGIPAGRRTIFALPGAWVAGGLVGLALPGVGSAGFLSALVFLGLGGLVAADLRMRPSSVTALAVLVGLIHGYMNGSAMAEAKLGVVGLTGIVTALFAVITPFTAVVASLKAPWMRVVVRVAGSWVVAIGLLMLGWTARGGL